MNDIYDEGPNYFGTRIGLLEPVSDAIKMQRRQARRGEIPPHQRPGHLSRDELTEREICALSGIDAIRHPLPDEDIRHT